MPNELTILDKVKVALRVSTTALDEKEIQLLIDAGIKDLKIAGVGCLNVVPAVGETLTADDLTAGDPLLERAVILYAKANFGYGDAADCERFQRAYDALKNALRLSGDYDAVE